MVLWHDITLIFSVGDTEVVEEREPRRRGPEVPKTPEIVPVDPNESQIVDISGVSGEGMLLFLLLI